MVTGMDELLRVGDVAAWLHYHPKTVQRMAKQGTIPAKRVGGEWRFLRSELERWMRRRSEGTSQINHDAS